MSAPTSRILADQWFGAAAPASDSSAAFAVVGSASPMSRSKSAIWQELTVLSRLAVPAALTQLGMMLMSTVDTIVLGRLSVEALDAAALGVLVSWAMMSLALGVVMGASPLIVQGIGAGDDDLAYRAGIQGLLLSLLLSLPITAVWMFADPILRSVGQDPELSYLAQEYLLWQVPSIPCFLGFNVLREYLMGRGIVWRPLVAVLVANVINAICDVWLVFGGWGVESMGVRGAAIATTCSRILLFGAFLYLIVRLCPEVRGRLKGWRRAIVDLPLLRTVSRLGVPIAFQLSFEVWAFQGVALIVGYFGKVQLGANTIVLNLCSLGFMMPLGISHAACSRVGQLMGAGRNLEAQRAAYVALLLGGAIQASIGLLYFAARDWLPRLYTNDSQVIALTAAILPIAAAFQLFDGVQGVGGGVLRGMGRSRPAAIFNGFGYYVVAIPLGWWLGSSYGMGAYGVWLGLCVGLMIVSTLVCLYIVFAGPRHAASILGEAPR